MVCEVDMLQCVMIWKPVCNTLDKSSGEHDNVTCVHRSL